MDACKTYVFSFTGAAINGADLIVPVAEFNP